MTNGFSKALHCQGKRKYANQGLAERALRNIWESTRRSREAPGILPCRVYKCECGH